MARKRLQQDTQSPRDTFKGRPSKELAFISSGCTLLDCVLGGGYPLGRVSNIVGDKSTGKTLLAIEACANFARQYGNGLIHYNESEAAFDQQYATALGLPLDRVQMRDDCDTVEMLYQSINEILDEAKEDQPLLYILDSLDALSDSAEMAEDLEKGTYGTAKAKQMSKAFRKMVRRIKKSNMHLMIISQVRDNIGVTFGRKYKRNGGKALDFYASQVLYLAQVGVKHKTVDGIKRPIGVDVRAKLDKSKVGLPFRECDFPILFGYGVDDITAGLNWLKEHKLLDRTGIKEVMINRHARAKLEGPPEELKTERDRISAIVRECWEEVESKFVLPHGKY